MNVGDRVRLLTGTEEGIVTRLLDSELVEVAIDNDFTIPVLRREVVVVAQEEGKNFDRTAVDYGPGQTPGKNANASKKDNSKRPQHQPAAPKLAQPSLQEALAAAASSGAGVARPVNTGPGSRGAAAASGKQPAAAKGLFLALVHQSPELLGVTLINNTEADVLFTYGEETAARPYRALAADKLGPKTSTKPLSFLHLKDFEAWPAVVFQLLPTKLNGDAAYELLTKRQAFKASTFYGSQKPAPVIGKDAYLFQLDEKAAAAIAPEKLAEEVPATAPTAPAKPAGVDAAALKAQLSGDAPAKPAAVVAAAPAKPAAPVVAPPHELDLHLEALRPDNKEELSNTAILRLQLDAFEDALSRALATNMHEIVFIHGMGNGVLRKEIHRQLSRNKDIKFFEDARKEKFGFGATLVRLK
ncbi:Smr/MutS family protein [Microvirga sp. STS02]|uniref:Smr/MutS family protein n=1 Tax=Hymenobacter negativus TaxID=2795026 RepID=UPI0018DCF9A7|nr:MULTISPECIES: Smr/MutS family protein [Bacteria]MBH8569645.1 Smr/MutS family protein [Hymenobacter negativus]MBR7209381.1 Smr/MutS family protein [Microvirga sp. STS02]